jgi:hypothetical protein
MYRQRCIGARYRPVHLQTELADARHRAGSEAIE